MNMCIYTVTVIESKNVFADNMYRQTDRLDKLYGLICFWGI